MGRGDISDPDRIHSGELRVPSEKQQKQSNARAPSAGRGGSSNSSAEEFASRPRPLGEGISRPKERRTEHEDRDRAYLLRCSEIEAMTDIGRFRAVDVRDLARFVYKSDTARMKNDLANLRKQGLIEEKALLRTHKPTRRMVTLTEQGHRMVKKVGAIGPEQKIYHGFVKPKELDHDADLYKVYQKAAQKIEEKGGKPIRIRLDFELKESINQAKEPAGQLPEQMRERFLEAVAHEHGLTADCTTIHLPDVQVEYQMPDGRIERENLELVSRNYREQGIRGKAAAGFSMYARAEDSARVRRALRDSGLIREVLSL